MKISYKNDIYSASSAIINMGDIISDIGRGKYQSVIEEIRAVTDNNYERSNLKNKLPTFLVGVVLDEGVNSFNKSTNVSSTGIIQFDIDEYDELKSQKIISHLNKNPYVIYSFLSPSNGVKFGVMTDFDCSDKSTIAKKYRYAYEMVQEEFSEILKDSIGIDNSVGSISQQCFLSYDPNVYFNPSCEKLVVNDRINHAYQDEIIIKENNQRFNPNSFDADDAEVANCLNFLPNNLPYDDRLRINFAVIDHFKSMAKPILMNHWVGVDDQNKLSKDIDNQIKSHNGKITIGTLFHLAKKYGYEYPTNNIIARTTLKPTYHSDKYYSAIESTKRLNEIILNDFFEQKKNKAVIVECGSGKTRTMFKTVSKYLLQNPGTRVAIFLKTHEMINQFYEDMNNNIKVRDSDLKEKDGAFKGMMQSTPFYQRPSPVTGLNQHCKVYSTDTINKVGTSLCEDCFYRSEESCSYFEQFENNPNTVRIYTHNRLFTKPKYDQSFKPDYIIIDEDIISMMTDTNETMLSVKDSEYTSVTNILTEIKNGQTLTEATSGKLDLLTSDSVLLSNKMLGLKNKIKSINRKKLFKPNDINDYQKLFVQKKNLEDQIGMIIELIHLSLGNKLQSKKLWVQYDQENNGIPRLIYGQVKSILPEYQNTPMLYLDGSGEKVVIESLLKKNFEFEHLSVNQQKNSKVYQFTNKASFSKTSFSNGTRKIDQIYQWIDTLETNLLGLIRYNRINTDFNYFHKLDEKVAEINKGEGRVGWFGNVRGINRFEDCDTLLVIGQHRLPNYEIFNLSQLIFREDIIDDETKTQTECYAEYIKKIKIDKIYRMKNGQHELVRQDDYVTDFCNLTSNHFDKSETYQSIHRLRLIHGSENKTVFIMSDTVLDITIDELLDRYKEFSDENIQIIKHIKDNKFLMDTNKSFIDIFEWTASKSKGVRDSRGSGDWLKSHRSLKYWVYKTKDRKTGKLYAWYNQSSDDVKSWLMAQGLKCNSSDSI